MPFHSLSNLIPSLYRQIAPGGPYGPEGSQAGGGGYECQGYVQDRDMLETVNKIIERTEDQGVNPQNYIILRDQVQNCLSDVGNVLTGSSGNDPSVGMYLGIAGGIAAGIAGVALYKRSKNNRSKRGKRDSSSEVK